MITVGQVVVQPGQGLESIDAHSLVVQLTIESSKGSAHHLAEISDIGLIGHQGALLLLLKLIENAVLIQTHLALELLRPRQLRP